MTQETMRVPTESNAREPRALATEAERGVLPHGQEERLAGWGVMGVTFHSGDVLAMRRFPVSSLGHGYSSVWHRDPNGAWTIWSTQPPQQSCARYFGKSLTCANTADVELEWKHSRRLAVRVPSAKLSWDMTFEETSASRAMNAMSHAMPDRAWRSPALLGPMARLAGTMLHAGHIGLTGQVPNGQRFIANPMTIWMIAKSSATIGDRDLGAPEPLAEQTKLGDFWIPQRGILAFGRSFFSSSNG